MRKARQAVEPASVMDRAPLTPAVDMDFAATDPASSPSIVSGVNAVKSDVAETKRRLSKPAGPKIQFVEVVSRLGLRLEPRLAEMISGEGIWSEQFRALREKMRTLPGAEQARCLGLVSSTAGEGKSTIAIALSLVLAQEPGQRVLLVDADLRKPDVGRYLGLTETRGLAEWLKEPTETVRVQRLTQHGLCVLSAGHPPRRPWDLIARPHLGELLTAARRDFDRVVVDCAPQTPVADTARIQDHLDAVILVVRARMAPREAILNTVDQIKEEKILGMVFNDIHSMVSNYYYHGYQYYRSYQQRA